MSGIGTSKGARFSKILSINSNDRQTGVAGDRSSNFVINLGTNLQECRGISYKGCNFYNNFYNVREPVPGVNLTYNNKFGLYIAGTAIATNQYVFNLPAGYYTATTLATAMISTITSFFQTIGVTVNLSSTTNPLNGIMTFTLGTSTPSNLVIGPNDAYLAQVGYANSTYGPWEMLGFITPFRLTVGLTAIADYMPSMGGITQINIQSRALAPANCFREAGQVSDWFQIVPVTAPFRGFNVDECRVDVLCELNYDRPRLLNVIDIQIVDHDGNEVNLNNSPFNLDIRVWYNALV